MAFSGGRARPGAVQLAVSIGGIAVLLGLYALVMHLTVGVSRVDLGRSASHRDAVYLGIHLAVLALSLLAGFVAGRWLNGLGLAYATLFGAPIAVGMVAVT